MFSEVFLKFPRDPQKPLGVFLRKLDRDVLYILCMRIFFVQFGLKLMISNVFSIISYFLGFWGHFDHL